MLALLAQLNNAHRRRGGAVPSDRFAGIRLPDAGSADPQVFSKAGSLSPEFQRAVFGDAKEVSIRAQHG